VGVTLNLKPFAFLLVLSALPVLSEEAPKRIVLTHKSNVPTADITKALQKECPNASITDDATKADFSLEAIKHGKWGAVFDVALFDRDGITVRSVTDSEGLHSAMKVICQALKREMITIEVVNPETLTQSADARGTGQSVPAAVANAITGRRTHSDATTMSVIVNGEHALLDCYERRKGCKPMGPGRYYGELDRDKKSIWIEHELPLTHEHVRDHYVIAGSW
jgi:hypothetical protein